MLSTFMMNCFASAVPSPEILQKWSVKGRKRCPGDPWSLQRHFINLSLPKHAYFQLHHTIIQAIRPKVPKRCPRNPCSPQRPIKELCLPKHAYIQLHHTLLISPVWLQRQSHNCCSTTTAMPTQLYDEAFPRYNEA